jgi:cytochrome c biogenesis protein CcdA
VITIAGLIDSLNPCAIAMIILLLTYVIVFAKKKDRVLPTGLLYILAVFLTYFAIGIVFYKSFRMLDLSPARQIINRVLTTLLLLAGLINIKDFFFPAIGPHLEIPKGFYPFLRRLAEKVSYPAAFLLGVLVTVVETPCSLPIYAGTANILAKTDLARVAVVIYFLYYNFLFVFPLLAIVFLVWKTSDWQTASWRIVELQGWQHQNRKFAKLAMGILLILMGAWLFLW